MTYGDVAASLGSRAARMVGQVMAYYGSSVPWWRVVRASGHPPSGHEHIALEHYRAEGTPLVGGLRADGTRTAYRVDLPLARHDPA
jgi:alkylated DNA nucleotide flippase Atl1